MASHLLFLNGPNLNLLGSREPHLYGASTLAHIEQELNALAASRKIKLSFFQSNHEGELVDRIHAAAAEGVDFIVINAGALTHSSIALRDALLAVAIPFIEVHLSNVYAREAFRHHSMLADAAVGCIVGLGTKGYRYAFEYAADHQTT